MTPQPPTNHAVEIDVDHEKGNEFGPYQVPVSAEVRFVMREAVGMGANDFEAHSDSPVIKFLEVVRVEEIIGPHKMIGAIRFDVVFTPIKMGNATIQVDRRSPVRGAMDSVKISLEIVQEW